MKKHPVLFITHRGERHQQAALNAAPEIFEVTMLRTPPKQQVIELLPAMEILVSERSGAVDGEMIAAGKNLRLIQRLGAQSHDIDLEAARRAGIPVCCWPVYTCIMVAELMLLQMIALARRLREAMGVATEAQDWGQPPKMCDEDYFAYNWSDRTDQRSIYRSTVGIVGFGEIGYELARRLVNFDCTLLYHKRARLPQSVEMDLHMRYTDLDALLASSDFVCMLLPWFPETSKMVNADFISKMKPGTILVSCGGSGILDEAALADALAAGKLGGLATDTFVHEPISPDNPLLPLARQPDANVILTPHIAAGDAAGQASERVDDYTNLLNVINGKELKYRLV